MSWTTTIQNNGPAIIVGIVVAYFLVTWFSWWGVTNSLDVIEYQCQVSDLSNTEKKMIITNPGAVTVAKGLANTFGISVFVLIAIVVVFILAKRN